MLRAYYRLVKPGIIYGNALNAVAAFLFASGGHNDYALLAAMLGGISLVIASACVFNNYLDRDIDARMKRTSKRALVLGDIPARDALVFGSIAGIFGFGILILFTNAIAAGIGLIGFLVYVGLYTPLKRRTIHATLIGAIAGAAPPVAGYCAVVGHIDLAAVLLFVILVAWQMPHFFAIGILGLSDYTAAGLPILPVQKGVGRTKLEIVIYVGFFGISAVSLTALGLAGYAYGAVMGILSICWFAFALSGYRTRNETLWARRMFLASIVIIFAFCIMLAVDAALR